MTSSIKNGIVILQTAQYAVAGQTFCSDVTPVHEQRQKHPGNGFAVF